MMLIYRIVNNKTKFIMSFLRIHAHWSSRLRAAMFKKKGIQKEIAQPSNNQVCASSTTGLPQAARGTSIPWVQATPNTEPTSFAIVAEGAV